jgi:hypothetical protein
LLFEIIHAQEDQGTQGDAAQSRLFLSPGKGSHTFWVHPALTDRITISGSDGDDAQRYQEAEVQNVLRKLRKVQDE